MTQRTQRKPPAKKGSNLSTLWWILGGVVGLGLIILLAISIAGEQELDASIGFGEITMEGDPLPLFADPLNDAAVGLTAAAVSGSDWKGNQYSITADGRPKLLVLLAHWCPHCQNEVPVIQQWINDGGLPEGVDMYSLTVFTDQLRPNWPPQDWLEAEGWTLPVIMDDEIGTAAAAYGMASTPMYVVLDGDNKVVQRIAGEIGVDGLNALSQLALESVG
ncbi:MAG TPA: TlpA disulfide reductase family protein [Acidimicrobiia bacterium]|nr:TlpA disulfide reductase family protein [Acidimicrobiia bacterium]